MPNWILKSAIQRVISWLPQSHKWNALLQKKVSKGYYATPKTFEAKLALCRQHLQHYQAHSPQPVTDFRALELGTGSWPIVPLGLYLCGTREIWTYDLLPLLEPGTLRGCLDLFGDSIRSGRLRELLPEAKPDRIARLEQAISQATPDPATWLQQFNIHVRVGDACQTGLPAKCVDLVFSTVVFEHIPAPVIRGLLGEFRRVLTDVGVMSHYIGLADQYASVDRSITPFNCLRYTTAQWRWLNNPITSQTRLRIQDHRDLLRESGFTLVHEENLRGDPAQLHSIELAPEFRHYAFEDLLVLFSWQVSRPAVETRSVGA